MEKRRNVAAGFYDEDGYFHPIRASYDYSPNRVGESGRKRKSKAKSKAKKKNPSNPSPIPVGKWVKAMKVKVNRDGTVNAMVPQSSLKRNPKRRNVAAGFYDEDGVFHPMRASYDYSRSRAGEKPKRKAAVKKRKKAKR